MKTSIKSSILAGAFLLASVLPAFAKLPWGSTAPLQVSGATPTCTYTTTALACIEDMTTNVTSITLAGMTAGSYYTLILMQDGTGSRTLAQASVTGAPALTTAESAANGYAVWLIKATSASAAAFVADYSNAPLGDTWTSTFTTDGTPLTTGTVLTEPTIVAPGMALANNCYAVAQTSAASWAKGIQLSCVPFVNGMAVQLSNPTATTVTPTAVTVNVRITQ